MIPNRLDADRSAAVVLGLDCITGLQTARILARHGIPVVGTARDPAHWCCRTRAARRVLAADPESAAFPEVLERLGKRLARPAVVFPCTDPAVLALARHRDRLEPPFLPALPQPGLLDTLLDKARFHAFAEDIGLPVPRTLHLRTRGKAETAAATLRFPAILKPAVRSARWDRDSPAKVHRAADPDELLALYDRCAPWADALVAQEWIEGPDSELYSCNCYFDERSEPLVTFVARKIRQWPPRAGTSCLGEECRNDEVLDLTLRLFRAARFHGLGYVEIKRDARTGRHYVLEANVGRPTGRSAIAEAGGVELLYTMYCDRLGLPLPSAREQTYGNARWIFWRQDVRSALHYWRRGELSLGEWAKSWRGRKAFAVLSWSDPVPFLADVAGGPGRVLSRRRTGANGTPAVREERDPPRRAAGPAPTASANGVRPERPRSADRSPPRVTEYDLHGVVGIRVLDASAADLETVAAQIGVARRSLDRAPDITLRFVDELPLEGFRHVEVGVSGFDDAGFYLRGKGRGSGWARVPLDQMGRPCEFVCERGLGRVPLLKSAVRLTALVKGHVPFHASAVELRGEGVLFTGWTRGGKTSALLALARAGARFVGDDLVLLAPDGEQALGGGRFLRLSQRHLRQLPELHALAPPNRRIALALLGRMEATAQALQRPGRRRMRLPHTVGRAASRLHDRARIALPVERIFPDGVRAAATPRTLFFLSSEERPDVSAEPVEPRWVADRMIHSQAAEALPLLQARLAYRFAFPRGRNPYIEKAHDLEKRLLERALEGMTAFVVRHPYPASLEELRKVLLAHCGPAATKVSRLPSATRTIS